MAMFLVERRRSGPEWDAKRPMEEQTGWAEHAAFMDALVESGFVVLGGPLEDERRVALAVETGSADDVRSTLAAGTHLSDPTVEVWTIRLDGRKTPERTR